MLLRIVVDDTACPVTVRLLGRLDLDGVDELQRTCSQRAGSVELDLSQLRSVDDVGAAYLRGLVDAGVSVSAVNPYVAALLRLGAPRGRGAEPPHETN